MLIWLISQYQRSKSDLEPWSKSRTFQTSTLDVKCQVWGLEGVHPSTADCSILVKHSSIKKIHGTGIKDFLPFTGQDLMLLEMCQENQEIRRHADLSCPVLDLFEKEVWRD